MYQILSTIILFHKQCLTYFYYVSCYSGCIAPEYEEIQHQLPLKTMQILSGKTYRLKLFNRIEKVVKNLLYK